MAESLKVIALISGGKDSIYSILHCLENGHEVVALGNLSSPPEPEEHDLNSFLYQTVGQAVVPLYERALGIPLYRRPVVGSAVHTGTSYAPASGSDDETEALMPLLATILAAHPQADALSAGAILSTYQRTRFESVARRLGLVPLSFLWQFPALAPAAPAALLADMAAAGLDARVVKVASGGLDESFLWENVACERGLRRLQSALAPFSRAGDGAVLGEGGEFETLVLAGPDGLFGGRIVVDDADRQIVREGGGTAWLRIRRARFEAGGGGGPGPPAPRRFRPRKPALLTPRFEETLGHLQATATARGFLDTAGSPDYQTGGDIRPLSVEALLESSVRPGPSQTWTIWARKRHPGDAIEREMDDLVEQLRSGMDGQGAQLSDVISVVICLRFMEDFNSINKVCLPYVTRFPTNQGKIYGAFFHEVNPPARVTIACGDLLPPGYNIVMHANVSTGPHRSTARKALHVQSRSYWAPANIGPYSQAQAVLEAASSPETALWTVYVAGQIPLVPCTMALPSGLDGDIAADASTEFSEYNLQAVLALQHLWRIGTEMDVAWWSAAVAYLARDTEARIAAKARLAGAAWEHQHRPKGADDLEAPRDLWEERHRGGFRSRAAAAAASAAAKELPDWSVVVGDSDSDVASAAPPFSFAAEVAALPRGAQIEWHAFAGVAGCPVTAGCPRPNVPLWLTPPPGHVVPPADDRRRRRPPVHSRRRSAHDRRADTRTRRPRPRRRRRRRAWHLVRLLFRRRRPAAARVPWHHPVPQPVGHVWEPPRRSAPLPHVGGGGTGLRGRLGLMPGTRRCWLGLSSRGDVITASAITTCALPFRASSEVPKSQIP